MFEDIDTTIQSVERLYRAVSGRDANGAEGAPIPPERDAAKHAYLSAHPTAEYYIDYSDFGFWRLDVDAVSLRAPAATRNSKARRVEHVRVNSAVDQIASQPETVVAYLIADREWHLRAGLIARAG